MSIPISYIFQLGNAIDTHQTTDMDFKKNINI